MTLHSERKCAAWLAVLGNLSGLSNGEVHVYSVAVGEAPAQAVRDACLGALQPGERARYERLVFERDRWPSLVGRGLLRHALSRYADVAPSAWRFKDIGRGKPGLAGPPGTPPLTFNVTNTVGLAACAVALAREVGVDAEPVARRGDLAGVAGQCLVAAERSDVERLSPDLRPARLLEYWTLKEAYLKAVGVGLGWPLRGIAFELDRDGGIRARIAPELGDSPGRWTFARTRPSAFHVLAVAAEHVDRVTPTILFGDGVSLLDGALPPRA